MSVEHLVESTAAINQLLNQVHTDDRERFQLAIIQFAELSTQGIEFRVFATDGHIRYLKMTVIEQTKSADNESCLFGILREMTPHNVLEKDREFNDALLQQAEQITDIGNFIYDEIEDRYIYASPGCSRIHGVTEKEYIESIDSVDDDISDIHELDRERVLANYRQYANKGGGCRVEYRLLRADGKIRWIRELLIAMKMQNGKVARTRGVYQDITREKTVEMELREAKDEPENLVKLRTSELANTINQLREEIEEREKVSAELEFLANHDPLTGLPSLRLCKDRLEQALAEARRVLM